MRARVENIEGKERTQITTLDGEALTTTYAVTVVVVVSGVDSLGDAVRRIERRITHGTKPAP